jgi:hypothetical protein
MGKSVITDGYVSTVMQSHQQFSLFTDIGSLFTRLFSDSKGRQKLQNSEKVVRDSYKKVLAELFSRTKSIASCDCLHKMQEGFWIPDGSSSNCCGFALHSLPGI